MSKYIVIMTNKYTGEEEVANMGERFDTYDEAERDIEEWREGLSSEDDGPYDIDELEFRIEEVED